MHSSCLLLTIGHIVRVLLRMCQTKYWISRYKMLNTPKHLFRFSCRMMDSIDCATTLASVIDSVRYVKYTDHNWNLSLPLVRLVHGTQEILSHHFLLEWHYSKVIITVPHRKCQMLSILRRTHFSIHWCSMSTGSLRNAVIQCYV